MKNEDLFIKGASMMVHVQKKASCVFFAVFLMLAHGLYAQRQRPVIITLASALPRNSTWGKSLDRIAADWIRLSNGEVTLRILHQYPGSEGEYMMKLRQDKIQAAVFTSVALNSIAPEVMALSIPLFIRNNGELDAVLREVRPILDSKIEEKGLVNLAWAKAGWVKIFSRTPVRVPNDLRRLRVATSPDEKELFDAFESMRFQMVGVTISDTVQFLNSGKIDAIYQSPVSVNAYQLYRVANNMCTVNIAPFMGGILMSKIGWDRVPDRHKPALREVIRQAGLEFENSFQRSEEEAVADMRRNNIIINTITPQEEEEWYRDIGSYIPGLVEKNIFNREMYQRIVGILENYRRGR
ncbi:MAG: TRAP transporter substrate-binding protein DctP [Treponema sp.]|nr:TRAP transporter substrate-binding protein DctP [Treponema sp.]